MVGARSRTRDLRSNFTGTYQNVALGTTTTRSLAIGLNGTCDDVVGNFPNPNTLGITALNRQYPGLVGQRTNVVTGAVERIMNNFPIGYHPGPTDPRSVFPALTTLEKSNYAWEILAKANPSKPDFNLMTFIAELKDLPSLMQYWNKAFIESHVITPTRLKSLAFWNKLVHELFEIASAGHLTWRWAIGPFLRDWKIMLKFIELSNKRFDMLNALASGKTIRRRVSLAKNAKNIVTSGVILHSEGAIIKGKRIAAFTEELWGTVKYKLPKGKLFPKYASENITRSRRLLLGISSHDALATAWELMPWSWLIDWFGGVGTVIQATNNTLGLIRSDSCLMRHTRSEATIEIDPATSDPWVSLNRDFFESFERKERFVVDPLLPFAPTYLPIFSVKAWSILGSLTILQTSPGRHLKPFKFLAK